MDEGITRRTERGLAESLADLRSRLTRSMRELAKSKLTLLQLQIVEELLRGRRTVAELVEAVYSLRRGDERYTTQYSKVRKEVRELESRGWVAPRRRLFGRNKPYYLTRLAVEKLTSIEGTKSITPPRLVPRKDLLVYVTVIILGVVANGFANGITGPTPFLVLALSFVFMAGIAFTRFLQTLGRVI